MTCEQFRTFVWKRFQHGSTRAERAISLKHYIHCLDCQTWIAIQAALADDLTAEQNSQCEEMRDNDNADPEFVEVAR